MCLASALSLVTGFSHRCGFQVRFFLGCFNGKARTLGPRLTLNSDDVTLKQKIKHHDFLEISENLFEAPEPPKTGEPELHTN
jgi:hypothetical protein